MKDSNTNGLASAIQVGDLRWKKEAINMESAVSSAVNAPMAMEESR